MVQLFSQEKEMKVPKYFSDVFPHGIPEKAYDDMRFDYLDYVNHILTKHNGDFTHNFECPDCNYLTPLYIFSDHAVPHRVEGLPDKVYNNPHLLKWIGKKIDEILNEAISMSQVTSVFDRIFD